MTKPLITGAPKLLVSACLLGQPLRYDGDDNASKTDHFNEHLQRWQAEGRIIAVCPETLGGLPTPRTPAETTLGGGEAVLNGSGRVVDYDGRDVSAEFIKGAHGALKAAQAHGATAALVAAKSPSCGSGLIYDGSFTRTPVKGDGVTTALLKQHRIYCFTPEDEKALIQFMEQG